MAPRIDRRKLVLRAAALGTAVLWRGGAHLRAEEATTSADDNAAREQSLKLMRHKVGQMIVRFGAAADAQPCALNETPLIHYSDQVRSLPESTLWVWERGGRPVLFCKVERLTSAAGETKSWQYCCVPAVAERADVEWRRDFRWRARETPFQWVALTGAADPRDQATARLSQMKAIAREFEGQTEQTVANSRQTMRLLTSPLHRYAAADENVLDGAVFGLTSNGTNPDALLFVESHVKPEGKSRWRYAIVGMTGDAVEITRRESKVWSKPFSDGPGDHRGWMWYVSGP